MQCYCSRCGFKKVLFLNQHIGSIVSQRYSVAKQLLDPRSVSQRGVTYLRENKSFRKTSLACLSGAQVGSIHEKMAKDLVTRPLKGSAHSTFQTETFNSFVSLLSPYKCEKDCRNTEDMRHY